MGFIPGLDDYSTTYQAIGLIIVVCVVLLIIVGVLICCCRRETTADSVRTIQTQNKAFAPTTNDGAGSSEPNTFSALVLVVPRWSALLAASHMHACGADYRLKHVIANAALKHGAYYVSEGDNANTTVNRKLIVARHPKALVDVIDEVFTKAMMMEFSNNMAANELLRGAYSGPTCWPGLQLLAALHTGEGTCCPPPALEDGNAPSSDVPLICHGAVVDDASFLAEHFEQNDGHAIVTATFLKGLGKHAPSEHSRRLQDLVEVTMQQRRGSALASSGPFKKWAFGTHSTAVVVTMPASSRGSSAKSTPQPSSSEKRTNNYVEDAVMRKIQDKRRHPAAPAPGQETPQDVDECEDVMDF